MASNRTRVTEYLGHPGLITVREATGRPAPRPFADRALRAGDLVEIRTNQSAPKSKAAAR